MLSKLILIVTVFNFHYLSSQLLGVASAAKCHPDDEAGLLAFKSGIKLDPPDILLSWIPGTDCCSTWWAIGCDKLNRVTILQLPAETDYYILTVSGTISPALSKLQYLQTIILSDLINLSGPFPSFLFDLPRLKSFSIDNNKFSGKLPENIGYRLSSQLVSFSVEGNRFSGMIPSSLGQLTELNELKLGGNKFTGNIPYTIGNLTKLSWLSLDRNQLTGTIPDFFKGLTNLGYFNVSNNKLSGNIPESITATTILRNLDVGHNTLSGKIPEFLGRLNLLYRMDLSWNQFQGIVPKSFANLTEMFSLDLSYNSLVDPFPELKVKSFGTLDLSYNQFHLGQLPAWVTSSTQFDTLKLVKCGIKFNLDDWKTIPTFYDTIDLSENDITGSPVQILSQSSLLEGFYASGNKLKFDLESIKPFALFFRNLDLSRNLVFGKVPESLSGLDMLNVSNNHLCGQLPKTKFPASAFLGNDCLCGSPLPKCKA